MRKPCTWIHDVATPPAALAQNQFLPFTLSVQVNPADATKLNAIQSVRKTHKDTQFQSLPGALQQQGMNGAPSKFVVVNADDSFSQYSQTAYGTQEQQFGTGRTNPKLTVDVAFQPNAVVQVDGSQPEEVVLGAINAVPNPANSNASAGAASGTLLKIASETSPAHPYVVEFGRESGHAVIESPVTSDPSARDWDHSDPATAADPLKDLHVVLAGLNKGDVQFFFK